MEKEQRAQELISSMEYINLATASSAGEPWNTPVSAVSDSELKFYWSSWKEAEHSKNIRANSRIFFTLYDSTRKRGDNNRRCLYLRGEGVELEDEGEIKKALDLLYGDEDDENVAADFLGEGLRRIYRAVPTEAWLNDKSERQVTRETIKMRIEVSLEKLKGLS